ncbi:hypothetical protein BDF22DRAFT_675524 [Syncephalis plumigaleata]|nr:hypothetical protein BDF22DRAFT_675524 [Syncephalis plumigaleata]
MHRRQHLHANILAEHENTAAGVTGRTPGIHRSNVMTAKMDTNSLAYKTPKANIGDNLKMSTTIRAPTGRRGLCDITNATPYVYDTDKPAPLQLTTQRPMNRRVFNDDHTLHGDATTIKSRMEEKVNTRDNDDIEYMPPRSIDLPYESDIPLNWQRIVNPDNPNCYSFRRTISLSTWSYTRTPETVNIIPDNSINEPFYCCNNQLLDPLPSVFDPLSDNSSSISDILSPIMFPVSSHSSIKPVLSSTIYARQRRYSLGKVIQSNRQERRRSSNYQGKQQQQQQHNHLNSKQTFGLSKPTNSRQFTSRLPVLIKGRRDIKSISTSTRRQHTASSQEYQQGNSRIPRYQHQNHYSMTRSQIPNITVIKRQEDPF